MTNKIYSACMAIVILATGIIAGSCSKNDSNNPQEPAKVQKYHMVVNADKAQEHPANTPRRVLGLDGTTVNASWAVGEEVTVYNVTKNAAISGGLTAQSSGARTTLSGDLTGVIEPSDILTLKFLSPDYTGQDGTLEYISAHCDYAEASVTVASVSGGNITSTADAVFENKQAIVKFSLISKADGTTLLNPSSFTINDGTNDIVTLTDIPAATYTTNGNGVLFVSIPGLADKTITLTASNESDVYVCTKENVTFANGSYYPITTKMTEKIHNGALPGEFSVSPTKRVRFSKGNLQYNAALGTHQCADGKTLQGTWRFAEHQWDYVGSATEGTVYENNVKCDNALISSTYNGWIDLFGWGTSGWNSGAAAFQPWSISTNISDYYPAGDGSNDLTGACEYADWGVYNAISNGGDVANTWRSLSKDEWICLLEQRTNAANLRGRAIINSVYGMIFLPDDFEIPSNLSFSPDLGVNVVNSYSIQEWQILESLGVVFLPEVGARVGTDVYYDGGHYWSTTKLPNPTYQQLSYNLFWDDMVLAHCNSGSKKFRAYSIRLVQDVE